MRLFARLNIHTRFLDFSISRNARVSLDVYWSIYQRQILTNSSNFSMQEERRDGEPGRTPTARPQETAAGFHRPSAPYSTGYF